MSDLKCAIDRDGEIQEGYLGCYRDDQLKERFPDFTIAVLGTDKIPDDYVKGHYKVVFNTEKECYDFKKKSEEAIKVIVDDLAAKKKSPFIDELLVMDADEEGFDPDLRVVVKYLQGRHGVRL